MRYRAAMIVVYGTVCLDRVRRVDHLPSKGGYAEIESELELVGGEAANTALALAQWGEVPRLYGNPIGTGPAQEMIAKRLLDAGIQAPLSDSWPTPACDIYVTPDGERTMFGMGFRDLERRVDLEDLESLLEPDGWFCADPNHGVLARRAVALAAGMGCRVYLLDFFRDDDEVPPGSYWQSSTDWVGVQGNTQRNVSWLQAWVDRHRCFGILSDGPNGFVAGGLDLPVHAYPPYPCPDLVDSTGAGDVFRAGMLFGLNQNWELSDCLRFASAAGCLNCLGWGATSKLPTREAIEALISQNPQVGRAYA